MGANIRHFRELDVYRMAMVAVMEIYEFTKHFPVEEWYSLTDQIKRSSRPVCAIIAESWRKRLYPAAFVSKLSDAETEVWLEIAVRCGFLDQPKATTLEQEYEHILGKLVTVISHPVKWIVHSIREDEADYA